MEYQLGSVVSFVFNGGEQDRFFFRAGVGQHGQVLFCLGPQVQQKCRVAAVVQDHVGETAIGPLEDLVGVVPVVHQGLALHGEDRHAGLGDGGGGVVLGGEDVAGGPAHLGPQGGQGLDQHRGLDGHMQ